MEINESKVVHLIYQLEVEGKIADRATKEKPLEFIFGFGYLLPKFEENIKGKKSGDPFDFNLTASEGYGEIDPNAVIDLPKNVFEVDGKIQEDMLVVGNVIPMMNNMGGVIPGKVLEVGAETVKMDFNHEMAGKDLHFTGEIILVRDATEEELSNGLHGERAAHNCDSDCSSCGCGCH